MPRQSRIDAPGALHHVIIRGIERQAIFKDDTDRDDFLDRIDALFVDSSTPCYAWSLMTNHVHLLILTAHAPLATLMRRLLTGYAISFNRRHRRHGQLFQNRYKSILCQEDAYLRELTRYIHLNPLRAGLVDDLDGLDRYRYAGHSVIMGQQKMRWQDDRTILALFAKTPKAARVRYRAFVEKGIAAGRRPEMVGGGLVRSVGGWKTARTLLQGQARIKGDERILGDSDFVEQVLSLSNERKQRQYRLAAEGVDLNRLAQCVSEHFDLPVDRLLTPGRYPEIVKARSVLCHLAVRELGMTATELARKMDLSQPAISLSVKRGAEILKALGMGIDDFFP